MHIKFIAFQTSFIVLEYTFQRIYELQLKLTIVFLKWGIYHGAKQTSLFSWERVKCGLYKNLELFCLMKMRNCKSISRRLKFMNVNTSQASFSFFLSSNYRDCLQSLTLLPAETEACDPFWTEYHRLYALLSSLWFHSWRLAQRNATPMCLGWSCVQHPFPWCHSKVHRRMCCPSSKSFWLIDVKNLSFLQPCDFQNLPKTVSKAILRTICRPGWALALSRLQKDVFPCLLRSQFEDNASCRTTNLWVESLLEKQG